MDARTADPRLESPPRRRTQALGSASAGRFRSLLKLLENASPASLLDGAHNFSRLAPADQEAALACFRDSRLVARRSLPRDAQAVLGAYYSGEGTWRPSLPRPPRSPHRREAEVRPARSSDGNSLAPARAKLTPEVA